MSVASAVEAGDLKWLARVAVAAEEATRLGCVHVQLRPGVTVAEQTAAVSELAAALGSSVAPATTTPARRKRVNREVN